MKRFEERDNLIPPLLAWRVITLRLLKEARQASHEAWDFAKIVKAPHLVTAYRNKHSKHHGGGGGGGGGAGAGAEAAGGEGRGGSTAGDTCSKSKLLELDRAKQGQATTNSSPNNHELPRDSGMHAKKNLIKEPYLTQKRPFTLLHTYLSPVAQARGYRGHARAYGRQLAGARGAQRRTQCTQ